MAGAVVVEASAARTHERTARTERRESGDRVGPGASYRQSLFGEDHTVQTVGTPIWRELRASYEWAALHHSPA